MKKFKQILLFPFAIIYVLHQYFTRKCFYISGTFLAKDGTRMFFKTALMTHGNVIPIKSMEKDMQKEFGGGKVVILFFQQIPLSMAKYLEEDYEGKIVIDKKPFNF